MYIINTLRAEMNIFVIFTDLTVHVLLKLFYSWCPVNELTLQVRGPCNHSEYPWKHYEKHENYDDHDATIENEHL